ncbi:alpha/beta hydrolase [Mycolicibacterium litorale]|uniref:alpha/beta hydrolase n=1 Tax=Mycolicibacterium litorale TaxID=758802 RepID=UPI003CF747DD
MTERVEFAVDGTTCVGHLRGADGSEPRPGVVMCTGFGGTQDTPAHAATAEDFVRAGYAVLTFDYRNFGESGGTPRQLVDIAGQLDDIAAAVACARRHPGIDPDRVVLWGTSLGGGHVVVAASRDPRVAAVISQIPFNGFPKKVEGRSAGTTLKLLAAMAHDALRGALRLPPAYIKAVAARGELAVMPSDEAQQAIAGMQSATWRNETAPRALFAMMRYRPAESARNVTVPVLVCTGDGDRETPPELTAALAQAIPKGELRTYPYPHFAFYQPAIREQVTTDQLAFLGRVVGTGPR